MIVYTNKHKIPFEIDEEDYERVSQHEWFVTPGGYVAGGTAGGFLHIFLIGRAPKGMVCDHINRNKLDCRKANIRITTHTINNCNRDLRIDNKTGYPGLHQRVGGFGVTITVARKIIRVGYFKTFEEAVITRKEAEKKYRRDQND